MTQAKPRFLSFLEYLSYSNAMQLEGRYELIEGELVELPPESERNNFVARYLLFALVSQGVVPLRLIVNHACEVQVPVLQPQDPANRYPDLVILRAEHPELTQRRLTITRDMPPPRLIVEILSPGKANRNRDLHHKRSQYAAIGVAEYWLIDPQNQLMTVLELQAGGYQEVGIFHNRDRIVSPELGELNLSVDQILQAQ